MDFDPEGVESTGIFRPDHARADNGQRFRQHPDLEDLVGVVHARMLERKLRRTQG